MPPAKPFRLILMPAGIEISRHASRNAAHATGRAYCDTDLFSGHVKQYIRIEGPDGDETWVKEVRATHDGYGFGLKYTRAGVTP